MYYSTPIYSFTMKCAECPNKFTIETDPKNCDYKITHGAKRKQESWDPEEAQGIREDIPLSVCVCVSVCLCVSVCV